LDVFAALPPEMQTEVARDYGVPVEQLCGGQAARAPPAATAAAKGASWPPLSQLDAATLQELPEELRAELLQSYAAPTFGAPRSPAPPRRRQDPVAMELPSPSQVDSSVWQALPPSMRAELEEAYARRCAPTPPTADDAVEEADDAVEEPPTAVAGPADDQQAPALSECRDVQDLRRVLRVWVDSVPGGEAPDAGDCSAVAEFLAHHVRHANLELPWLLLRHLDRLTADRPSWRAAVEDLIAAVQACVMRRHGSRLAL
jgi:hypothetical protein